jgi:pimeloyl-ACP methyl ester carboxylesterase
MGAEIEIRRLTVSAGGLRTTYLEAGRHDAEPLLLLHDGAYGSDALSCWEPVIARLAEHHRVLAPDLLGHGGTAKVVAFDRDPQTQRIDHVRAFCSVLCLDSPVIVGNSFGGGMVLRGAASRGLPMRAGASICGPGGIHHIPERFAVLKAYEPTLEWSGKVCSMFVREPSEAMIRGRLERSRDPGHYKTLAAAALRAPGDDASRPDWRPAYREALMNVAVPLLLIGGGDDDLLDPDWMDDLASLIPRCETLEVAGARHQPQLDDPDAVCEAILRLAASAGRLEAIHGGR